MNEPSEFEIFEPHQSKKRALHSDKLAKRAEPFCRLPSLVKSYDEILVTRLIDAMVTVVISQN